MTISGSKLKTTVYTITDPIAFAGNQYPFPDSSQLWHSQGQAGGVLLVENVHYTAKNGSFILARATQPGDLVIVTTPL